MDSDDVPFSITLGVSSATAAMRCPPMRGRNYHGGPLRPGGSSNISQTEQSSSTHRELSRAKYVPSSSFRPPLCKGGPGGFAAAASRKISPYTFWEKGGQQKLNGSEQPHKTIYRPERRYIVPRMGLAGDGRAVAGYLLCSYRLAAAALYSIDGACRYDNCIHSICLLRKSFALRSEEGLMMHVKATCCFSGPPAILDDSYTGLQACRSL